MKIFKFGGACIQDPQSIKQLAQLVKAEASRPLVVVVSAMGKTTRALEHVFQQKIAGQPYAIALQERCQFHQNSIDQLLVASRQEARQALALWKAELLAMLSLPLGNGSLDKLYSGIVANGELLASKLVHYYLRENKMDCGWVDARNFIKTNSGFCSAQVDWEITQDLVRHEMVPLLAQQQIVVTQGFIGSNAAGETTTLGKEGSDFTGALLAASIKAHSFTIWKDVPGVMNADPQFFKAPIKFDKLSYQTMITMAFYGAKVVHPKTIQPLAAYNIPVYIKSFYRPHEAGTAITNDAPTAVEQPIYMLKEEQGLMQFSLDDRTCFDEERRGEVLRELAQQNMQVNMLQSSAHVLSVCVDVAPHRVALLLEAFKPALRVHYQPQVSCLTVLHQDDYALQALPEQDVLLAVQGKGIYQAVFQQKETQRIIDQLSSPTSLPIQG